MLTLDPGWFGAIGMMAAHGAQVLGVPCTVKGPDLVALERMARDERPRLLFMSSATQNPTGLSLATETVKRVLEISSRFELHIFEDDATPTFAVRPSHEAATADTSNHFAPGWASGGG